jgi:hypothetical protein
MSARSDADSNIRLLSANAVAHNNRITPRQAAGLEWTHVRAYLPRVMRSVSQLVCRSSQWPE